MSRLGTLDCQQYAAKKTFNKMTNIADERSACRDREWFSAYTPFESYLGNIHGNDRVSVAGSGTVVLPVDKYPHRSGAGNCGQIILKNVLHSPSLICNVLSAFQLGANVGSWNGDGENSKGWLEDQQGRRLAYFDPYCRMYSPKISAPPTGPVVGSSAMSDPNKSYMVSANWGEQESRRWVNLRRDNQQAAAKMEEDRRYNREEKAWLKANYGGEFHFLRSCGLSIYKEDEREEGRAIIRQMMASD